MEYTSNQLPKRSPEAILREAQQARARAVSDLLASAATGLANLAAAVGRGLGRAGRGIASGVVTMRTRRAAIREMQALDDRLLKDIGVSRSDIPFLVEHQLSTPRARAGAPGRGCEITAFPDRQATAASPRALLRPAA